MSAAGVTKLFMTSYKRKCVRFVRRLKTNLCAIHTKGGVRCSTPPPGLFGYLCAFAISLHNEYFSTLKLSVGPLGATAILRFVFPPSDREKSMKCDTPSGPAIVV